MKNIAIIPARGGSKRIPKKNIKNFCGKSVIAYSIETAFDSGLFEEVMVSTDSIEIAEIAQKYGASVPFMRSEDNANDFATIADVLIEVIDSYKQHNTNFDHICCIFPVAPLIKTEKLKSAYNLMVEKNYNSVIPVAEYLVPLEWALQKNEEGKVSPYNEKFLKVRSQDISKSYFDVGMFYWMKVQSVIDNRRILCDNTGAIVLGEMEMQDIDTLDDWKLAELKYKLLNK
ncbi:MAG: pseudaminic acid cytidylyltransferase [Salinivirgaceae bacterium]|jgi:pseudaminic acid cytidylyltransferase|nr:pseudaminic acid cytidylyltransferase [Salinivirgaceae bacterium]